MEDLKDGEPRHPLGVDGTSWHDAPCFHGEFYAGPQPNPVGGEYSQRVPLAILNERDIAAGQAGGYDPHRLVQLEERVARLDAALPRIPGAQPTPPQNQPAPRARASSRSAGEGQGRPPVSGIWEALRAHEERFNSFQQYVDTRLDQIENRIANLDLTVFGGTD